MGERKKLRVVIDTEGRDKGKTFLLHEMPADQGERWFFRMVLALANAGAKIPEEVLFAGAAGFADLMPTFQNSLMVAMRAMQGLQYDTVRPLLDEMVPLIKWLPPGTQGQLEQDILPGANCQIEEVTTWVKLRFELIQLHVGFSLAAAALTTEPADPSTATA